MLDPRKIALQGIGFEPRVVAVQGFVATSLPIFGFFAATETGQDILLASGSQDFFVPPPLFIVNVGRMMGR